MQLEQVLDLDLRTFNRLLNNVLKLSYRERIEDAWTRMLAAQGKEDAMKRWLQPWQDVVNGPQEQGTDIDSFISDFGSGA